jgi:simple sugar transport system permease protein
MEKYLIGIMILYSIMVSLVNHAFFSLETLFDLIESSTPTMILALGVLIIIISGGFDVSFTAIAVVAGYTSIKLMTLWGINNLLFAFFAACLIGIFLGLINALLIYCFKLPTFVVTLGTSSIFFGLMTTFVGTSCIPLRILPKCIVDFGSASIFEITTSDGIYSLPLFFIFVIALIILVWFILYRTMLGRSIFAIGNSQESAIRAGINIFATQLFIYCFMGALAGIMSIIYFSNLRFVDPISLVGSELTTIAAVVIGGAKVTGGDGTILGTVLGVSLIMLLNSTLVFLGLSTSWNNLFIGTILIISLAIISRQTRIKNRANLIFTD